MIHRPAGCKPAGAGAGYGMARFACNQSWNVAVCCGRLAFDGCIVTHRRVTILRMAAGAIRGIVVCRVVHRPVWRSKSSCAGTGGGMASSTFKRGRYMVGYRRFVHWYNQCSSTECLSAVASGTPRGNTGVIHSPFCVVASWACSCRSGGMACLTGKRGWNVSRRLGQHDGRGFITHVGSIVAAGTT